MTALKCLRCGHAWTPRVQRPPQSCPRCKSYEWHNPKQA